MLYFILAIIFILTPIEFTNSLDLNSADFCFSSSNKTCNVYRQKFKCTNDLCTLNKNQCDIYTRQSRIFSSIYFLYKFQLKFKNCQQEPPSPIPFKLLINLNTDLCSIKPNLVNKRLYCTHKYPFRCQTKYCARNSQTCSQFIKLLTLANRAATTTSTSNKILDIKTIC